MPTPTAFGCGLKGSEGGQLSGWCVIDLIDVLSILLFSL